MTHDIKYLNALNSIPGVGPVTLRLLKENFATYEEAWRASETALSSIGLRPEAYRSLVCKRPSIDPDREMEKLVKTNVWIMTESDQNYPKYLAQIHNPPVMLYGRGTTNLSSSKIGTNSNVAVVGTRRPSAYGLEACESLVHELASVGLTIISGLATGIDARAHSAALDNDGETIAVLGSGVDHYSIFPPENRGLARRIEESGGAVISEYAPGTPAHKENFPLRNRIVSGLSRGVLVIEARERSGALITARLALEQNRDVFALPGSIFSPHTVGPHKLIQEGAKLVTTATDVLEELGIDYTKEKKKSLFEDLTDQERTILGFLEEPLGVDFIQEKTNLATTAIVTSLSMLELKGLIRNLGGDTYQKI